MMRGLEETGDTLNLSYLRHLVGNLSGLVHIRAREVFKSLLTDLQFTPKQAVVLEFIANNRNVSQKEIAQGVVTTPAMLVGVLDVLTGRGLVERVTDAQDRRRTFVRLTPAGEAVLGDIRQIFHQVEDILREEAQMSEEEWATLVSLLRKITERGTTPQGVR